MTTSSYMALYYTNNLILCPYELQIKSHTYSSITTNNLYILQDMLQNCENGIRPSSLSAGVNLLHLSFWAPLTRATVN